VEMTDEHKGKRTQTVPDEEKFQSIRPLIERKSPFAPSGFEAGLENLNFIGEESRILVVGAGGLGCEILKDLALSGFKDIEVIDLDTIDVSNLNRQFLFRLKDTDQFKADVAAEFIMKRCKGVKVTAYHQNIMEFDRAWYKRFQVVIAGLDNIEARDWLNKTLIDIVEFDEAGQINWDTVIPFIDGGTTGFAGQARVVIPYTTACYHCTLASLPPEEGFHLCTIASKPRKPEHCIAYALMVEWPRLESFTSAKQYKLGAPTQLDAEGNPKVEEGKIKLNKDDPQHMTWLMDRANERADKFNIKGVTYMMTMQVVKNIIPALASTNAIVSAACVNEAWKYLSRSHPRMNSYFQYYGHSGVTCQTFPYQRNPECDHCSAPVTWKVKPTDTLQSFVDRVKTLFPEPKDQDGKSIEEKDEKGKSKNKTPTIAFNNGTILYAQIPGMDYSEDLPKPLSVNGVTNKSMLIATNGQRTRRIIIKFG